MPRDRLKRDELGMRAAAIVSQRYDIPLDDILSQPPTFAEKSIALNLAGADLLHAVRREFDRVRRAIQRIINGLS